MEKARRLRRKTSTALPCRLNPTRQPTRRRLQGGHGQQRCEDDIDRKLATDFGSNTAAYTTALAHAKTLQAALVAPGATQVAAHIAAVACADQAMLDSLKAMTLATPRYRREKIGLRRSICRRQHCQHGVRQMKNDPSAPVCRIHDPAGHPRPMQRPTSSTSTASRTPSKPPARPPTAFRQPRRLHQPYRHQQKPTPWLPYGTPSAGTVRRMGRIWRKTKRNSSC